MQQTVISPLAKRLSPYVPGEQPKGRQKIIKLNTNENPYPPAPGVVEALKNFDTDKLRLYPEPTCKVLVDAIADYYGIRSSQVFTGVGSDDVLAMIFMTFFNSKKPILFPDITYSFYDVWANMLRIPFETKALDDDFQIKKRTIMGKTAAWCSQIRMHRPESSCRFQRSRISLHTTAM